MFARTANVVVLLGALLASSRESKADPTFAGEPAFLEAHCIECHDPDYTKGNLDLTALGHELSDPQIFASWVKVYDKVLGGQMPPKHQPQPEAAERDAFLSRLLLSLVKADEARIAQHGRAVRRRLNRLEYENTLADLLSLPGLEVKHLLPEDGEAHLYNKVGEALDVSHVNMSRYLHAAEHALRQAMMPQATRPAPKVQRYHARDQRAFRSGMFQGPPVRQAFPILGYEAQPPPTSRDDVITVGAANPRVRNKEAVALASSTYEPTDIRFDSFRAPSTGFYKIRLSAYSIWIADKSLETFWKVDRSKITPGRRPEPVTLYADAPPEDLRKLGTFDVYPRPKPAEITAWLNEGETIRPDASRLVRSRPPDFRNPLATPEGMPAVAYRWLEVEGPLVRQWPPAGHKLLFGDLPVRQASEKTGRVEVISSQPEQDAQRLLHHFLERAYRRPITAADEFRFFKVIKHALDSGYPFTEAMIAGYTAVLSSPEFLYIDEKPGRLGDRALATRLSYFLWNTQPDETLQRLAAEGRLHEPHTLRQQTERMLADSRARRFVNNFLDYWLDLRKISASAPDATLYPDYQLDDLLVESMSEEPQLFFKELLERDLPATNLVDSRFAILNERLAAHYDVPGVRGAAFRRVRLPEGSLRGGLMTQASVLKVTANGTTTSPVVRGAWIMERILGQKPPAPPPSVPAVEPDTSGATTIREQLAKHSALPSCAGCHVNIDPPGFALEAFDPMGGWRDRYRAIGGKDEIVEGFGHNGLKFAFAWGPATDSSGQLPDGRTFKDVRDLKRLLVAQPERLARNLVHQLATYATGAPVGFADRTVVEEILERSRRRGFGVRTLLHELVQSELFRKK